MAITLRIPRRLESPNTWNGRHWRVKHRISQEWETAIGGAWFQKVADDAMARGGQAGFASALEAVTGPKRAYGFEAPKMRVEVERHVPSGRNFIRDDDNLRFAVKPLLDALRRLGYIKNDSRRWLDHPTPTQRVSDDGKDWTVVTITVAA